MSDRVPEGLAPALERALRARQASDRAPSVAAAAVRDGEIVWTGATGAADLEAGLEAAPEMQYRIGSITKTFTAVAVMRLRDAGELDLDDRLEQHLPGIANGSPTIRRLLAHLSGLQREAGDMFATGEVPTIESVLESMEEYEQVLPAARAHHYSNLGYGLLGEIVTRVSGVPYTEYVDGELLAPLGLERTTWREQEPYAVPYLVDEFSGAAAREPLSDMGGIASMGQLWSTVDDLCRWGSFLVEGHDGVLAPASAAELWAPQVMLNPDDWTAGWGLGLELLNAGGRIFGGHSGAMPGFLAGLFLNRESKVGAAVLTNSGTRAATRDLAVELAGIVLEQWPAPIEPWRPEEPPPPEVAAILGRWWSEGNEFVFAWRDGKLIAEVSGAPPRVKPAVFEPLPEGGWRVESGRERGERLHVVGEGRMIWAGYAFTRRPEPTPG